MLGALVLAEGTQEPLDLSLTPRRRNSRCAN
jgi:hypothetical protein